MSATVKVQTGHFLYVFDVEDEDKAHGTAQAIMSSGVYRHRTSRGTTVYHKAYSVTVEVES